MTESAEMMLFRWRDEELREREERARLHFVTGDTRAATMDAATFFCPPPAVFRGSQGMTRGRWWKVGPAPDCMRRAHERLAG